MIALSLHRHAVSLGLLAAALLLWPAVVLAQVLDAQLSTPNGTVYSIVRDGNTIYIGGEFTSIQPPVGPPVARKFIAALDATTGLPIDWAPEANNYVRALAVSDGVVYAGGLFTSIGGQTRNRIAALDPKTGAATAWDPNANSTVYALAPSGGTVLAGGSFTGIGGQSRSRIAALDATTGAATAWDPGASATVRVLMPIGSTVYVGGNFLQIGGQARNRIAALDAATGAATAWDPNADNAVYALAASGSTIYAGGGFVTMGGQDRYLIAALDATTGAVTAWDPGFSGGPANVEALVADWDRVYAGGHFTAWTGEGGDCHGEFATIAAGSGRVVEQDLGFCSYCTIWAMTRTDNTLYVGGEFTEPRAHLAAFILDQPTPVLVSLVSAQAEPGRVRLTWTAAGGTPVVELYRRAMAGDWQPIASLSPDGTGMLTYEDTQVAAGMRYGYRLGVPAGGQEVFLGETWVDVPGATLALAGLRPNPAEHELVVNFSLPDASPARLEVLDVSGRRICEREVGAFGAGSHVVDLAQDRPLPAGIYLIRLTHGGRSLTARGVVIR
jgi:hypothetical protein